MWTRWLTSETLCEMMELPKEDFVDSEMVVCPTCDGNKKEDCDTCGGDGLCAYCRSGECPDCGGVGTQKCSECGGEGEVDA